MRDYPEAAYSSHVICISINFVTVVEMPGRDSFSVWKSWLCVLPVVGMLTNIVAGSITATGIPCDVSGSEYD